MPRGYLSCCGVVMECPCYRSRDVKVLDVPIFGEPLVRHAAAVFGNCVLVPGQLRRRKAVQTDICHGRPFNVVPLGKLLRLFERVELRRHRFKLCDNRPLRVISCAGASVLLGTRENDKKIMPLRSAHIAFCSVAVEPGGSDALSSVGRILS